MKQDAFEQLVQDRYRRAVATHQDMNFVLIELQARVELLERGETIEAVIEEVGIE